MTTPIVVTLVLLLLLAALFVGAWLGRVLSAARDEQQRARTREELADARVAAASAVAERDAAVCRAEEIAADRESMVAEFRLLSNETAERQGKSVDTLTAQRLEATEQLLTPVADTLEKLQTRLTQVEKDRVALTTDLNAQVRAVRDTGEALRKETASLVTALRKPQVRGAWGETKLRNVARVAGMTERCDFDLQLTSQVEGQNLRPDMRVHLSEGKHVFVDSKVPLSAFLDAAETDDEQQQSIHLASFAKHVRTHVDQLSSKQYWKAAESPEFVVLFLPSEAFYAAALDQMPDLDEYAVNKGVVLATPNSLIAMLRMIAYCWKQAALAETAAEVFRLGRELHERLGRMGDKFDKLGRALTSSVTAYNATVGTVEGTVLVTARRFRDLQVSEKELTQLPGLEATVRQVQAPELVVLRRPDPDVAELVAGEGDDSQDSEFLLGS